MSAIRRMMTETEAAQIRAALPRKLQPLMDEIEYCIEHCYTCDYFEAYEHKAGSRCKQFDIDIPREQQSQRQACHAQKVVPF